MTRLNEIEEIIRLIHNGYDLELLAFELDIPIQQLQEYKKQLEMRRFVKDSIKCGKIDGAIETLNRFIESTDNNLIERLMLLKLKAYANKSTVSEEDLEQIEEERKTIGFLRNIDDVLDELRVQIPKRKNSNIRKKEKLATIEQSIAEERVEEVKQEEIDKSAYEKMIQKYKREIASNPQRLQNKRNLLAFAYFKAGRIDEARDELMDLIDCNSSYMAYRQLIHLESAEGNFEDAKLWAEDAIEKFPNNTEIREHLISIAREENDDQEIIKQLKGILSIKPESEKSKIRLEAMLSEEGR